METTKPRLHPLLTAAAVSLTVFSAVGVAALTGVLPHSRGSSESLPVSEAPQAVERTVTLPAPASAPVVAPTPKPKATPRPAARQATPPAPVAAPKPAPLPGVAAVVESVREVEQAPDKTIAGPVVGGITGAILGHQIGSGRTRTVATAVGAGAGILAGKVIEKKVRSEKVWETTVRLDDGSTQSFKSEAQPGWHAGERVRVVDGQVVKSAS